MRTRRILKRGWRLQRAGDLDGLAALARAHDATALRLPLQAMCAKCLAEDDDRDAALKAFNALYAVLKQAEDRDGRHLKLFALYNLALIRNSIPDAAFLSRKARELKAARWLRAFLPIPLVIAPPQPGPAITSMV